MSFRAAHLRAHGVPRAAGRVNDDVVSQVLSLRGSEAELREDVWDVLVVSFGGGIFLGDDGVELRFGISFFQAEDGIRDVKRLERAAEAGLNQFGDFRKGR